MQWYALIDLSLKSLSWLPNVHDNNFPLKDRNYVPSKYFAVWCYDQWTVTDEWYLLKDTTAGCFRNRFDNYTGEKKRSGVLSEPPKY